jgi:hypothetical protein
MDVAENVMAAIDNYRRACEDVVRAQQVYSYDLQTLIQHREHIKQMLVIEIRSYAVDCQISALDRAFERIRG